MNGTISKKTELSSQGKKPSTYRRIVTGNVGSSVMPDLHGFQIEEVVAMSSPVVLITGALTGIGRATARLSD